MAGHSKWANIKRRKGAQDAKRSKLFSKMVKEITVAAKEGGSDPDANPRLRTAIDNAKGVNMPKDNIQRAISKASSDERNYEPVTFEGYGPGGIGIYVECLTDNRNRTVSTVRSLFTKKGGNLGKNGSLQFIFEQKGVFEVDKDNVNTEDFELELIDAGAQSIEEEEDFYVITTSREDFGNMQKKLKEKGIEPRKSQLQRVPNYRKSVDLETARKVLNLVDAFEDEDDVQNVYHNLEMTEELEKELTQQ